MDSDYGYSSEEDSYEAMGSEGDSFDFDSQAEVEMHAKKVLPCNMNGSRLHASSLPCLYRAITARLDSVVRFQYTILRLQVPYVVYNEEQLRERQQDAVKAVAGVLSISDAEVVRVLRQFKWYVHEALHTVFQSSSGQSLAMLVHYHS